MIRRVTLCGLVLLGGCAVDPATQARIDTLERQNQDLSRQLEEQGRVLGGVKASGLDAQTAGMQEELRQLRGQVEKLAFELKRNDQRQRDLYLDLDRRLQALDGGASAAPQRSAPAAAPGRDAAAALSGPESQAYLAAFQKLKDGQYAVAIDEFRAFLAAYPQSSYAGNAQYWIGEAYYVQRQFPQARAEFEKVVDQHGDSSKVPDASLKIAYVMLEQKQDADAHALLKSVIQRFPKTTAARLATEKLAAIGTP